MKQQIEKVKEQVEFFVRNKDNPTKNKLLLKNGGVIPTPNISKLNGACKYVIVNNIMLGVV